MEEYFLKVLFVDSGGPGFNTRYSYDVYTTLVKEFNCLTREVSPQNLSPELLTSFRPDILLVMHGSFTPCHLVRMAKSLGATTILWIIEDPYEIDLHRGEMVNSYDYIFTNERLAVGQYSRPNVYYLPWCCNPAVHRSFTVLENYQSDICFVGMGFRNRVRILNAIAPQIQNLNVKLIGDWQSWGEDLLPSLKRFVLPTINDFREVQKYYNGAKINLNIHRDPVDPPTGNSLGIGASSPNDRTFALAGCSSFQLVDRNRSGIWEYFTDGVEIVGFSDPMDLGQKINFYLGNPQLRKNMGKAAQRKAYSANTFKHRLAEIFRIINKSVYRNHNNSIYSSNKMSKSGQVFSFSTTNNNNNTSREYRTRQ
jgi:spore maturation protein CgeB